MKTLGVGTTKDERRAIRRERINFYLRAYFERSLSVSAKDIVSNVRNLEMKDTKKEKAQQ